MSPVQVRVMRLKGFSQLGLYTLVEQKVFDPAFLTEWVREIKNNQRICDTQNNNTAVFINTESLWVFRVVYWNELVMSPVQVRVMSLKGLSQLGFYTLVEQKVFDLAFFTKCMRGIKNNQRIRYTHNNSTAVFTDTEPLRDFRVLWRLSQRCLHQTESYEPL